MSTTVKAGWLKDSQGNKFAPKTLSSQVVKDDGTLLENSLSSQIDELKIYTDVELAKKADNVHDHDDLYYTEAEIDNALESIQATINAAIIDIDNKDAAILTEAKDYSDANLEVANAYTDQEVDKAITEGANSAVNTINTKLATYYYDKEQIDNYVLITTDEIDTIWGYANPSTITFTIDGTECQAEQGMTWEQWVNSDYNKGNTYVNNINKNCISSPVYGTIITYNTGNYCLPTDAITANYEYSTVANDHESPEPI